MARTSHKPYARPGSFNSLGCLGMASSHLIRKLRVSHGHLLYKTRWSSFSSSPKSDKNAVSHLSAVNDTVRERKLPPELRGQRSSIRSETDIINIAEQRIWQSMKEGQFENLAGKGKPLELSSNPHADAAEDTLFRILAKNKCAPEWVELNKEIRSEVNAWRTALKKAWANRCNQSDSEWIESCKALKLQMSDINNKVFRYNLIVPFGRQMFGVNWEKEVARLEQQ